MLLALLAAGLRLFFFGVFLRSINDRSVLNIYSSVFFSIGARRLKKTLPAGVEPATLRSSAVTINNSLTLTIHKYYRLSYRSLMNILTTCSGRSDLGDSNTRPAEPRQRSRRPEPTIRCALVKIPLRQSQKNLLATCSGRGKRIAFCFQ